MRKESKIIFIDERTKISFEKLRDSNKTEDNEIYVWLNHAFSAIEGNAFCGIQIPKRLIPKEYGKYNLGNLWKYNLPKRWRLLYSITGSDVIILSTVIEWLSHKEYERRFGY